MGWSWLADTVMVVHFGFLVFVALGGFLAWRYRAVFPLHLAAIGWAALSVFVGVDCPLTYVENWFRQLAGRSTLDSGGFIQTYLTGVIYPADQLRTVQTLVALLIVTSWVGLFVLRTHRPHRGIAR